uniref:Uncharacterized protein n=1 Tax=Knipowitschia caucasica TaxID=637954 RepID=A0AAV2KTK0_KNICA
MDKNKLRLRVLLMIALFWISSCSLIGEPLTMHDTALNLSQPASGVSWVQTTTGVLYKLRSRTPHLTLLPEYSQIISSNIISSSSLGMLLMGLQSSHSPATLFSLCSPSSPILQIISSSKSLSVEYWSSGAIQKPFVAVFPRRNPFVASDLIRLAVSVEPERVTFFVECDEAVVVPIETEERINLTLPGDLLVTVGSTPGRKHSKLTGHLLAAELSLKAFLKRPWDCGSTDHTVLKSGNGTGASTKPQKRPKSSLVQEEQRDQQPPSRGVVLGPPSPPHMTKSAQAQGEDGLKSLELKLSQLAQMVDMMKAQNAELQTRVQYLEGCECVRRRPRCVWEAREVEDGRSWYTDINTLCTCSDGEVSCQASTRAKKPISLDLKMY